LTKNAGTYVTNQRKAAPEPALAAFMKMDETMKQNEIEAMAYVIR
jgi:hypothetical protein